MVRIKSLQQQNLDSSNLPSQGTLTTETQSKLPHNVELAREYMHQFHSANLENYNLAERRLRLYKLFWTLFSVGVQKARFDETQAGFSIAKKLFIHFCRAWELGERNGTVTITDFEILDVANEINETRRPAPSGINTNTSNQVPRQFVLRNDPPQPLPGPSSTSPQPSVAPSESLSPPSFVLLQTHPTQQGSYGMRDHPAESSAMRQRTVSNSSSSSTGGLSSMERAHSGALDAIMASTRQKIHKAVAAPIASASVNNSALSLQPRPSSAPTPSLQTRPSPAPPLPPSILHLQSIQAAGDAKLRDFSKTWEKFIEDCRTPLVKFVEAGAGMGEILARLEVREKEREQMLKELDALLD